MPCVGAPSRQSTAVPCVPSSLPTPRTSNDPSLAVRGCPHACPTNIINVKTSESAIRVCRLCFRIKTKPCSGLNLRKSFAYGICADGASGVCRLDGIGPLDAQLSPGHDSRRRLLRSLNGERTVVYVERGRQVVQDVGQFLQYINNIE